MWGIYQQFSTVKVNKKNFLLLTSSVDVTALPSQLNHLILTFFFHPPASLTSPGSTETLPHASFLQGLNAHATFLSFSCWKSEMCHGGELRSTGRTDKARRTRCNCWSMCCPEEPEEHKGFDSDGCT